MKFGTVFVFLLFLTVTFSGCVTNDANVPQPTGKAAVNTGTKAPTSEILRDSQAPTLRDLVVTEITQTTAKISWVVTDQSEALTTHVEYDVDSAPGFSLVSADRAGSGPKTVQLTDLAPNTLYRYRLYGRDAIGNNDTLPPLTFRTLPVEDTEEPSISGVTTSSVTLSAATISWFVDDENASVESWVTYGPSDSDEHLLPSKIGRGQRNHTISGLTPDTLYRYRVHAIDARLNQDDSTERQFRTLREPDTAKPTVPALRHSTPTLSSVVLYWEVDDDSGAVVSYLEWGETTAYGSRTNPAAGVGPQDFILTKLKSATTYHYRVFVEDGSKNNFTSADKTFRTQTPTETIKPTITGIQTNKVKYNTADIQWTPDDNTDQVTSHLEYRRLGDSEWILREAHPIPGVQVETLTGLTPLTTYEFRIYAIDPNNNEFWSPIFTFQTPDADLNQPTIDNVIEGTATLKTMVLSYRVSDDRGVKTHRVSIGEPGSALSLFEEFTEAEGPSYERSVTFTDLKTDTTYNYRIDVTDKNNNPNLFIGDFKTAEAPKTLTVTSTMFADGGQIPVVAAWPPAGCLSGQNRQPQISVAGLPSDTSTWVISMVDLDSPGPGDFVHWLAWNLPATQPNLPENQDPTAAPFLGRVGNHDYPDPDGPTYGQTGYAGPCPDVGEVHEYRIRVYALDAIWSTTATLYSQVVGDDDFGGEVLAWGELSGFFEGPVA